MVQGTYDVQDGLITRWQENIVFYPWDGFEVFTDWVASEYPEHRLDVAQEAGLEFNPDVDPDLALQLLAEYRAYLDGE